VTGVWESEVLVVKAGGTAQPPPKHQSLGPGVPNVHNVTSAFH
jgi:hypothetical protein